MPISRKTTVAQGFFREIYQKQPIEVPLILLTTKTNIGKLKVARSFLAQRSLSDMRTLFWSNMVNLKMSSHFWPNKPIEENLHNRGEFEDVCTFLIKRANLSKFTVARPLFNNFKLFNKSRQFQGKRQMPSVFWRHFRATGQLHTMFCTSFSFLTKDANSKKNDSCAEHLDANFAQNESCARSFSQALASYGPIWKKTVVAQFDLMRISRNRKVMPAVSHNL